MIQEWRGFIQKRTNGSEMVNYDDPNFPSYVYRGYVYPSSTWANDPHFHDDIELLCATKGYLAYNINGEEIFLNEGDTIFVNSRQIHFNAPKRDERTDYVIIIFHPRILCASNIVENKYIKAVTDNPNIPYIRFDITKESGKEMHKQVVKTPDCLGNEFLLTKQFYAIWELILNECGNPDASDIKYSDSQVNSLKEMLTFIQQNYASNITLDDIAAAGNVSRTFCNNLFHKYTDQTPIENLTRFRVSKVAELLNSSNLSMSEIAYNTGFASASYMAESFKKYYGESPRSFKTNHVHTPRGSFEITDDSIIKKE
ncbi:MAG: AraC family transcriptional regulator [Lachnospiraceae bacterium]|nr:AraC family transcriptional regulator [Lachnospiraceae bacterium]